MYVTAVFDIICYKTCIKQCFWASMETTRNVCRPQIPKYKKSVLITNPQVSQALQAALPLLMKVPVCSSIPNLHAMART